ncbi:MAG: Mov34/MPN/PAD-1 family protein [Candidatus Stahlbacteria bacterium]|nr:Mov34/MPN/PAD-1 family protein [Candidatus Stahlbacteria bacterium]
MERIVHIKERAFLSMILSSIEVYRHETLGLLLGYAGIDKFVIEHSIPYQTAVKGYSWVSPKPKISDRRGRILKHMPINVIGDFHSHTQWGTTKANAVPSGEDIADMEPNRAYIIVAVNDKEKAEPWHQTAEGTIKGTLDEYVIELGAYILVSKFKAGALKVICPSATGLSY